MHLRNPCFESFRLDDAILVLIIISCKVWVFNLNSKQWKGWAKILAAESSNLVKLDWMKYLDNLPWVSKALSVWSVFCGKPCIAIEWHPISSIDTTKTSSPSRWISHSVLASWVASFVKATHRQVLESGSLFPRREYSSVGSTQELLLSQSLWPVFMNNFQRKTVSGWTLVLHKLPFTRGICNATRFCLLIPTASPVPSFVLGLMYKFLVSWLW